MCSRKRMLMNHLLVFLLTGFFALNVSAQEAEAEAEELCLPGLEVGVNETAFVINGTIASPGYLVTSGFPELMIHEKEIWDIYIHDADGVQLTLLHMDVEPCCGVFTICDIIQTDPETNLSRAMTYVYDTNERGKDYPVLRSRTNHVRIIYSPRGTYFGAGFKIYYLGIRPSNTVTCDDRIFVTNTQEFEQLFYEAAPVFKSCYVFMRADPGFRIDFQIVFMDMEPSAQCTAQGLSLYNIFTPRGRNLANVCRYRNQPQYINFISENTDFLLGLVANPGKPALIVNYKVFNVTRDDEIQCTLSDDFMDTDYYIEVPKYATYELEFDVTTMSDSLTNNRVYWIIEKKRSDDILFLIFTKVDLDEDYNCTHDSITVKRGSCWDTSPVIAYFCGSNRDRYSQTHGLWTVVLFQTDMFKPMASFKMLYRLTSIVQLKARPLEMLGLDDESIVASVVVPFFFMCALVTSLILVRRHYKKKNVRVLAIPGEGALYGKIDGVKVPPPFNYVRPADARP